MSNQTNCPNCGRTNVKGRDPKNSVTCSAICGAGIGTLLGGPIGTAIGCAAGAAAGKLLSKTVNRERLYKCPRCGCEWLE